MLVRNDTPFMHGTKLTSRKPPQPEMVLVVRGTFRLVPDGAVTVIEGLDQEFLSGEVIADDDCEGEVERADDFADFKLSAEVLLQGSCHAPRADVVTCPVRVRVGDWEKALVVYGDREWERGITGRTISDPEPFERMPLDFAHAFGGPSHPLNPVGRGAEGDRLPNVELPSAPIVSPSDTPPPASFAPISSRWPQRADRRGKSYGAAYRKERAPYYADDFDWRHFSAGPEDQQLEGFLRGDEEVKLHNLHPEHAELTTRLPGLRVRAFLQDEEGRFREIRVSLDTLCLRPDEDVLALTWRGVVEVAEDDFVDVTHVLIATEDLDAEPLAEDHYCAELEAFAADPTGVLAALPQEMLDAYERMKREERGEPVEPIEVDPELDPVSRAVKQKLGGLISDEELAPIGAMVKKLDQLPEEQRDQVDLDKRVSDALAADQPSPPPMRTIKPGTLPDPGLRKQMRELMEKVERLREAEREAQGQLAANDAIAGAAPEGAGEMRGLDELAALPHDPRLKELDPTYEPPGPLSTDEPGPGADLRERDLSGGDLSGMDLSGANLERADLSRANLRGANLRGAKLSRALLWLAELEDADLTGADLTLAHVAHARAERANLTDAILDEAYLEGAKLGGATLDGVRGVYAIFEEADLREASLCGASFDNADFTKAKLTGATARRASAVLALFGEGDLAGVDFTDATLTQASFIDASLEDARLVGASAGKGFFMGARLERADLSFTDLREAHLTRASARGARFYGANLRGARLYRSQLQEAALVKANLMGAELRKANLEGAQLMHANLYEANLAQVRGSGFDLTGANLERAILEET